MCQTANLAVSHYFPLGPIYGLRKTQKSMMCVSTASRNTYPVMGSPIQLSVGARAMPTIGAPALGADTEEVFAKYGKK